MQTHSFNMFAITSQQGFIFPPVRWRYPLKSKAISQGISQYYRIVWSQHGNISPWCCGKCVFFLIVCCVETQTWKGDRHANNKSYPPDNGSNNPANRRLFGTGRFYFEQVAMPGRRASLYKDGQGRKVSGAGFGKLYLRKCAESYKWPRNLTTVAKLELLQNCVCNHCCYVVGWS